MEKLFLFSLIFFLAFISFGQTQTENKTVINSSIYRGTLYVIPSGASVNIMYEKQKSKTISLVGKAAMFGIVGQSVKATGETDKPLIAAIFSAECRYYFNIKKRERKEKNIENLSGQYFSFEFECGTAPFFKHNQIWDYAASNSLYFNYGIQQQIKSNLYFNAYLGAYLISFTGNNFIEHTNLLSPVQLGVGFGYVF